MKPRTSRQSVAALSFLSLAVGCGSECPPTPLIQLPAPICASYAVLAPTTQLGPFAADLNGLWSVHGDGETSCRGSDDQPLDVDLDGDWIVVQDGRSLFIDMLDAPFRGTWTGTIESDGSFAVELDGNTLSGRITSYASTPGAWYVDEAMGDFTALFPDAECSMPILYDIDVSAVRGPLATGSDDLTGVWEFRFAEYATQGCQPDVLALLGVMVVQDPLTGLLDIVELEGARGLRLQGLYYADEGAGTLGPESESAACGMLASFQVTAEGQIVGRGGLGEFSTKSEFLCATLFTIEGERVGP